MATQHAALSDVGKVRSSNQDSGYAGTYLYVVADGMGGHAGGDVASHVAIHELSVLDQEFSSIAAAEKALKAKLLETNLMLANVVNDRPELAGLGTTVSALLRVGNEAVIAHIGDSRIYRRANGSVTQVTVDHTFVQRLIDSGRLTEEEALTHPRRSVLMRVLGDVDSRPEIDTSRVALVDGERWVLCTDGLTGIMLTEDFAQDIVAGATPTQTAKSLVEESLQRGAPDNVTVVVVDIAPELPTTKPKMVGSAAKKINIGPLDAVPRPAKNVRQASLILPVATNDVPISPAHATPTDDVIRHRRIRRRITAGIIAIAVAGVAVIASILFYQSTQDKFYLAADGDSVVIYQGIPQDIGPISMSHIYKDTNVSLDALSPYGKTQVQATLSFDSLAEAEAAVQQLAGETK